MRRQWGTNATIASILALHTSRHGVERGVETNCQVQISAPCLPLDTGKLPGATRLGSQPAPDQLDNKSTPETRASVQHHQPGSHSSARQVATLAKPTAGSRV
jgi:hypothetical protein